MRQCFPAALAVLMGVASGLAAEALPTTSSPTSRPASEIVLVRVGDTIITQEDFNRAAFGMPLQRVEANKVSLLRGLIGQRLLSLYLDKHPELVDQAKLEEEKREILRKEGVTTPEELEIKMKAQGTPGKLDYFLDRARMMLGRQEIIRRTQKYTDDDAFLQQLYEKDKSVYDGTRMFIREIRISIQPWDTPEQLRAKRDQAERIREDLVSGRRTWEQCLSESDSPTRITGGEVGFIPRHLERPEPIAAAAFELKPGETSQVIEDRTGFYVIQVTSRHQGTTDFEHARKYMKLWLQWEPLQAIDVEMRAKHPIVGVREPDLPPPPASMPAAESVGQPGAATRPAGTTRPASATRPGSATRPSAGARPRAASRPAAAAQPRRSTTRPAARPATRPATGSASMRPPATPGAAPSTAHPSSGRP